MFHSLGTPTSVVDSVRRPALGAGEEEEEKGDQSVIGLKPWHLIKTDQTT